MQNIKSFSKRRLHLKQNIWNMNIISIARSYNSPLNEYISLEEFNYKFEKEHGLLKTSIAEETETYSYS